MRVRNFLPILFILPLSVWADARSDAARIGVVRPNAASRMPTMSAGSIVNTTKNAEVAAVVSEVTPAKPDTPAGPANCRDAYRACMDDFCLLDESEGYRCACSDNINQAKSLIQEIQSLQSDADKLFTEGVERENMGAKASLVFGESAAAKKSYALSGISFADWLNSGSGEDSLTNDDDIGGNLYAMAAEYCAAELDACGARAEMEEVLYSRQVIADCKAYDAYLADQKANAQANKRTAEAAVRQARLEMLDTTNKYNRGECLLAYRSCIADKGGCGTNFENCLDESLLERRAYACENVLDQCMAVKSYVLSDWDDEAQMILVDAAKYADRNQRATCSAKVQDCLEQGCSLETNPLCLSDINVAIGICPVISECDEKVPGFKASVVEQLAGVRVKFCENDLDACLQQKCGVNFTAPECIGKSARQIADDLCPKSEFMACNHMQDDQFEIIVKSAVLHMDTQLFVGCINQYAERLNAVCGTDMSCLPMSELMNAKDDMGNIIAMDKWISLDSIEGKKLQSAVQKSAHDAVDRFFQDFDKDLILSACLDVYSKSSVKVKDRIGMKDTVNTGAKGVAYRSAENRALRELSSLMDALKIETETSWEHKYCLKKYQEESVPDNSDGSYTYIRSVSFEPSLHNCHVCRMQRVCEVGGESKGTSALKAAAGGLSAGASAGTMVTPGWGTAIGAVVGAVGAGLVGMASGGEQEFCQEIESCEDINVGDITEEDLKSL